MLNMFNKIDSGSNNNQQQKNNNNNDLKVVFQSLGIPLQLCQIYERIGLTQLYAWQSECLYTTNVLRRNNLVYCAPTSGGKTLVAELVLLKTVLSLQKKAIFILPFVSLVLEKEKHLNKILQQYNQSLPKNQQIQVEAYYGEKGMSSRSSSRENIIICTIEKANMIFNTMVLRKRANSIGCFIFDETHVLGNKMNGYLLEILITKIKLYELNENKRIMEEMSRMQQHPHHTTVDPFHIQIIALSATMGNVSELANWLQAKLFITNFRPIPLVERIKAGNEIYSTTGELTEQIPPIFTTMPFQKEDPDHLTFLTSVGLQKGQQIILFCPTKQQCVSVAEMLLKMFTLLSTGGNNRNQDPQKQIQTSLCHEKNIQKQQEILLQRKRIVDELFGSSDEKNGGPAPAPAPPVVALTKQQSILKEILLAGIAFHHSSLTPMERIVIEKAFRQGWISVLCATTTLAAGVNLPAGRIIIRSLTLGKDSLSITNYKQMAGRAGRMGQTSYGESFLVVRLNQKQDALNLVNQSMPNIQSQIHPENDGGNAIVKAMIDLVGLEIIQTSQDLLSFIRHTLLYQQQQQQPPGEVKESNNKHLNLMELVQNCYSFILENKIIDAKPFPNSFPLPPIIPGTSTNYRISTTKFGRAFLRSGMDPDEAIIFYESLLLAQEHLFLDNSLHIFYLLSPLDHPFIPDCQRIFHFYQKSRKNSFSFHLLLDSIGLTEQVLHPWLINPPTKAQLELSTQMLRIRGISSSTATSSSSLGLPRSSLSLQDWKRICCVKRLWSAMILQQLSDGYSYEQILKEYSSAHNNNNNNVMMMVSIQDVDNLHKNTRIIMSKLEKFCKEMNWKGLMKLFHFNKKQFEINSISSLPKEMKKLLLIPSMTKKLAKILLEHSIKNPKQFLSYSIEEIIQFIQLSCGFELQEIDENSFQLFSFANENDDDEDTDNNKDQKKDGAIGNRTESLSYKKKDDGGVIAPIKKTRDEMMRERLAIIVSNLLQSARALVTEVEKKKKEKEKEKLLKMAAMTNPTTAVAVHSREDPFGDIPDSELEKFFDIQAGTIPSTSVAQTAADQRTIPAEQREYTNEIIEEEEEEEEVEEEDPLAILMESDDEDEDQNADDPSKLRMEVDSLSSFSDNDDEEDDQDEELEEEDEQRKEADQDEDLDDMNYFPAERLKTQFSTFRDRTSPDENDLLSPALKLPRREDSSRRNITPQQQPQQQQQQSFQSPSFSSTTVKSNIHRIKITPFKQSPADPLAHPVFASPLAGNQQESHISSNPATRETDTDEIEFYLSDADLLKVLEEFENKGFILPQQQQPPQNPSENNHPQTNNLSISVENYPAPSSSYSSHSHKKDRSSNPLQSIADSFIQEEEEEGIRHILSSGVHESRKFVYLPYENQIVLNQTKSLPATRLPPERSFIDAPPHSNSLSFHNDHYQEELNALNQFYLPREGLHEIEITMNVVHQPDFLKDAATIADHHQSNIDENNHAQQERMIVDPEEDDELPDEDLLKLMDEWERKNNPDPRELAGSSNRKLTPKNNRSSSSSYRKILNFSIAKEEEIIRTPSNNAEGDHTEITQEMNSLSHHPEVSFVFSQPGQPPLPPLQEDPDQTMILESQEDDKLEGIARVGEECEEEDDEEVFSPIPINLDTSVIYAKKSPYLTPFTASKIPSPGKYLYYGALTHHEEAFLDQSILLPDHDDNEAVSIKAAEQQQQPSLSSSIPMIKPQRVDYSQMNLLNYFTMQLSFQSFHIHDLSSPRSTADGNWKHCDEFIHFLQTSKFISFELLFKQFPLKFLHAKHSSSSSSSASSSSSEQVVVDPIYQGSWSSLLSYNYHPSVHITSSHLDNQIKSPLEVSITAPTTSPTATSSKNPQANPLLLTGITFNFGLLESFHLKLPQVMPLIYSSSIYSNPPPSSASLLEQLPMKLKERICLFIGFPHFLYQSVYLYQFLQSRQQQSGSPSRSSSSSSSKLFMRKESNNLFLVSKFWCFYCRQLLIYEWRKGGCYEWKLVQEIMNSSELIKIGSNLKAKLQFLRDRDIFLAGIAEDPVIAVDLLKNSGDIHCPTPITTTTTASSTASTRMNDEEEVQEESSSSSDRILQKKKAMATATGGSNNKKNSLSFYPLTMVPKFQLQEFLQAFHPKIQSIVQFHMTATFPSSSSSSSSSSTMLNSFYFLPPKQNDSHEFDENINPTIQAAATPMLMTAYRESIYHSIKAIYFSAYLSFYNFYAMKLLKIELQKTFQWDLYSQIEMPLIPILSDSEYHGIEIAGIQLQIIRQQWIDRKQLINKLFQQFFRVSYSFNVENVDDVKKIKSFLGQLLNKIFGNPPPPPSSSMMMIPPAISPQQSGRRQPLQSNQPQLAQQQRQQSSLTDYYFQSSSTSSLSSAAAVGVYQQFQTNSSVSQKITSSDWSAGKRKRTFPDEQQPAAFSSQQSTSSTANTFPPSSSSSSSLPTSLTRMREEFQENHPFTLLLHEFRSITRSLPLINAIIRNRRFSRIRGDYHPIGTETGRMIITSPPLQQTPKETLVIPGYHPTLFEEILQSTQSQQQRGGGGSSVNTVGQEIRNIPKEFIEMMNENNWQTIRHTGNYEWVKVIPSNSSLLLLRGSAGTGSIDFYASELFMAKLIFIFPGKTIFDQFPVLPAGNEQDTKISSILRQHLHNQQQQSSRSGPFPLPSSSLQQQLLDYFQSLPLSCDSFFDDWTQSKQFYFHSLSLPQPPEASSSSSTLNEGSARSSGIMRLIPLVLIEIPSYHKKHHHHQQQQHQSSCYQLLPAHHLYRVHSNVLPCPKEFQLLQKATTLPPSSQLPPSVTPLHYQYSNYFSPYFSEYASLQKKYQIRQSFIASPGYILLTADYSQIELRLLTHFCKEENLLAAFNQSPSSSIENNQNHFYQKKKEDIFERLASIYKRKPIESITKVERNEIKQLCYAVIYGAGSKLIAENMNISTEEAKQLIADFHKRFPSIQRFINELYEECAEKGYVETLFGRKRYLSFEKVIIDPKNKKDENNWKILSKLQRQVINSLCQGSAADLVKLAMVNIHKKLEELSLRRQGFLVPKNKPTGTTLPPSHNIGSNNSSGHSHHSGLFHYRTPRSHPGCGLYRQFDDCRLLLQIHDELVYEVRPQELIEVASIIKESMEKAVQLAIPLEIKLKTGMNWNDLQPYELPSFSFPPQEQQGPIAKNLFGNE